MRGRSLKDLIGDIKRDLGFDRPPAPQNDDAMVRTALERIRPDLLFFLTKVTRDQTTLTLEFQHAAAAQEAQLETGRLLIALEKVAGGAVARSLKCRGPR